MKRLLPLLVSVVLVTAFYSCKEEVDTSHCSNGVKDEQETEIDCGGACEECPPPGSLTCKLGITDYISTHAAVQVLPPSIRVYAVDYDGRTLNFMFQPTALNTPLQISALSFNYRGEPYSKGTSDTGVVVITHMDSVRKMISGTFYFTGNRVIGSQSAEATDGVFTNVRYDE